jgi:RNA polymerase sigma factor (sigma-70 family)
MSDKEIIDGCLKQDPKMQQVLYQQFAPKLMGIARRYAPNREDAEDIFQEGYVRVFQYLHTLQKNDSLEGWLKKVMIRTAINHYQKHKKYYEHIHTHDYLEYDASGESEDYQHIISKLSNEDLLRLIHQLPDGYRMIFNLYVIEGYSHKEIAEMLNTNAKNSKSQLSKAKKALKKMMEQLNLIEK